MIELMDITVNTNDPIATGKRYATDSVRLIGKTGTAQYALANGKYSSGNYNNIRSFAGMFPKDNPEYVIYVSAKNIWAALVVLQVWLNPLLNQLLNTKI